MVKNKKYPSGFTLIEMLVVVLIIGILAGIALPQYQMAVTKAKVASILPIMRRWYDALQEYKLRTGSYKTEDDDFPNGSDVSANWPTDWKECGSDNACGDNECCSNDYWVCETNMGDDGSIFCTHYENSNRIFSIVMNQPDANCYCCDDNHRNTVVCVPYVDTGEKICKTIGKFNGVLWDNRECIQIGG